MNNNNDRSTEHCKTDEPEHDKIQRDVKTQKNGNVKFFKAAAILCILWQTWIIASLIFDIISDGGSKAHLLFIPLIGIGSLPIVSQIICILIAIHSWDWPEWKAMCIFSFIGIIYLYMLYYIIRNENKSDDRVDFLSYLLLPWVFTIGCIMSFFKK